MLFVNCAYPTLERDALKPQHEYLPPFPAAVYHDMFFIISGMSHRAISRPAVEAISKGAAKAGIWLKTGKGGLSSAHLEVVEDIVQIGTANCGVRDASGNLD